MMIMDLLTVGTPQGIMTVEATVNAKGRGHQVMAMIIMAAGISIIQGLEFRVAWSSVVVKIGLGPSVIRISVAHSTNLIFTKVMKLIINWIAFLYLFNSRLTYLNEF